MFTVYKYRLPVTDEAVVEMPLGAKVLHFDWVPDVGMTHLTLWALVDPTAPMGEHRFLIRGTGFHLTGEEGPHVATVLVDGGVLVWHVFEGGTREPETVGVAADYAESAE